MDEDSLHDGTLSLSATARRSTNAVLSNSATGTKTRDYTALVRRRTRGDGIRPPLERHCMHLRAVRLQVADVFHLLWSFDEREQCNLVFSCQLLNSKVRR